MGRERAERIFISIHAHRCFNVEISSFIAAIHLSLNFQLVSHCLLIRLGGLHQIRLVNGIAAWLCLDDPVSLCPADQADALVLDPKSRDYVDRVDAFEVSSNLEQGLFPSFVEYERLTG